MAKLLRRLLPGAVPLLPVALTLLLCFASADVHAQARFDLTGPKIDVRVTRNKVTLPIAAVPNLQPGDQLWLHPAFPPSQSVKYLLVCVFLRGTTNPPPDEWFNRIETWNKRVREEGVFITVPAEAQQAMLFLAPETGGDFTTLRSAVKGRPGIFVRASQDLTEAGFEQARIEKYLAEIKQVPPGDPAALLEHSNLLARTLNLKPNPECFKKPVDQQYSCLTQSGTQMLLDDGHGQTVVASLSNGPGSDFINAASYMGIVGAGTYSAYVGAIVDLVRLTSTLHTAQYQYIPAIAFPDGDDRVSETLNLRLNTPPSFHNPKSVIVIGLPAVQKATLPPLRPADPNHISCLLDPHMALPIEGAPLVFSTSYAHGLRLRLNVPGQATELPLVPDAYQGGLTIDRNPSARKELPSSTDEAPMDPAPAAKMEAPAVPGAPITGTIEGYWGFDRYVGPTLPLQNVPGQGWKIVTSPETPVVLIAGQPNSLRLAATGTACVESISLEPGDNKLDWKLAQAAAAPRSPVAVETTPASPMVPVVRPVEVTLNLQKAATPGSIQLGIQQFGKREPDHLGTKTFAEPAKIETLQIHAGDTVAVLTGNSLDEVKALTYKDQVWTPVAPDADAAKNSMTVSVAQGAKPPSFKAGEKMTAEVQLQDGRTLQASTTILPARPAVTILSRRVVLATASPIQLASADDLPLGGQLTFFLKSKEKFRRDELIEIASKETTEAGTSNDPPLRTTLSVGAGSLVLQDNHTIIATFDPLKTFGASTFGQFRLRAVAADGTPGEWMPLATIVRLPVLSELHCAAAPAAKDQTCLLSGSSLYLIDSVAADADFAVSTPVPEGFVEPTLAIPHPAQVAKTNAPATFYIRLRDDPTAADAVTLPVEPEPAATPRARTGPGVTPGLTPPVGGPVAVGPPTR